MVHVSLDDNLYFEALSYAWDDRETIQIIYMEMFKFYVQQNLYDALRRLRIKHDIRYLWIDALCIDQIDNIEKSTQVRNMTAIYTKADKVLFWLGEAADDSDQVIDMLPDSVDTEHFWFAAKRLFSRPCWNLIWCLQELSVAQKAPIIVCGEKSINWSLLETFHNRCRKLSETYPDSKAKSKLQTIMSLYPFVHTRECLRSSCLRSLLHLLDMAKLMDATDARDYIYSLVGLARDVTDFQIDYTQNVRQVYIRVAQHMISVQGRLEVLSKNTNSLYSCFEPQLPSWVSDWTIRSITCPVPIKVQGLYRASANHQASVKFEEDRLIALGILADRVERVSERIVFSEDFSNLPDIISSLAEMASSYSRECLEETTGHTSKPRFFNKEVNLMKLKPDPRYSDTFWRTITLDRVYQTAQKIQRRMRPDGMMHAPPEVGNMYEIFRYGNNAPRRARPEDTELGFDYTAPRLQGPASCVPTDFEPDLPLEQRIEQYISPLKHTLTYLSRRQFFITADGRMGIATYGLQKDDIITILYGSDVPLILRQRSGTSNDTDSALQLIGDAYVHGMMNGEIAEATDKDQSFPVCKFNID